MQPIHEPAKEIAPGSTPLRVTFGHAMISPKRLRGSVLV